MTKKRSVTFTFGDGDVSAPLLELDAQVRSLHHAAEATDDATLKTIGREYFDRIAEQARASREAAAHRTEATADSAKERKRYNADRDRSIHDAARAGKPQKAIAAEMDVSVSTVSRVLNKPRP